MTVPYDKAVKRPSEEFEYDDDTIQELLQCSEDVFYFSKYVKIITLDKGRQLIQFYPFQEKMLQMFLDNRFSICLCARQLGKSTLVGLYALWYASFNADKFIGIASNKEKSAIKILDRIKVMYKELPSWLKPGVLSFNKKSIEFENGSVISVSATTPDAMRGESLNLLILDEFAFVPKNQANDFWTANYPTISSSDEAKVIIISTPCGKYNLFHTLYEGAEKGTNEFKPFKAIWNAIPGRDEKWKQQQLRNIGRKRFTQEYLCEFLGSDNTLLDTDVLEYLQNKDKKEPLMSKLDGCFDIFEEPKRGRIYVLGVDSAKGTGEHYSTIQVMRIDNINPIKMEQVAVYNNNKIDVYSFAEVVNNISIYYNNAYIVCENNAEGSTVVTRLWWVYENEGLLNSGNKDKEIGIRATRSTKPKAVLLMKKLIEERQIELHDETTIKQLTGFVEENGKYFGRGIEDDLVSALYWSSYIFEFDLFEESGEVIINNKEDDDDDVWDFLTDDNENEDMSWVGEREHSISTYYN